MAGCVEPCYRGAATEEREKGAEAKGETEIRDAILILTSHCRKIE